MINNFLTKTSAGLYCQSGDFYLDPKRAVDHALVSHAHGDHAVRTPGTVYCTAPTKSFMQYRFGEKSRATYSIVEYEIPFYIKDVKITYFPAGHILGSAQILLEHNDIRYLYTGDFKVQPDATCEQFCFVECDHLITETTFASPEYNHPEPEEEIRNLLEENKKVIIGAYVLGKSQRISQLISSQFPEFNLFIHPETIVYHRFYEEHGFPTGDWKPYGKVAFERSEKSVYIVPPSYFRRYNHGNALRVFATGWKRSFYSCDRVLQISDHADWPGVLEMVKRTKAKNVYTVHGNGSHLKEYLKDSVEVKIIG